LPVCPIDAISAGDPIYVIDAALCVDFEDCLPVCPVNAIVQLVNEEVLLTALRPPVATTSGGRS
jgi:Fe-S-cluster-containing hydrogenase component 2